MKTNPFEKNPFRDDFDRVSELYKYHEVFAEHLERASAIHMAKLIAVRFNLVVKIERLHVRFVLGDQWDADYGDGDWFTHHVPDEWVACHEPNNWAVTLSDNSNKKMAALKQWDKQVSGSTYPFNDEESFERWFSGGGDPAVVVLEEIEERSLQPVKQARGTEPQRPPVAEITDIDELGNGWPDLDEWHPDAKELDPRRQDFEHELRPPDHSVNYIYDPEE